MEIFKDIPGYEGIYQVSDLGRVKSFRFNKEKNLKPTVGSNGYYTVGLCKGKRKTISVHQLVAMTFLNHKPDGTTKVVVDHIDNNPLNNRLYNLQLVTNRENTSKNRNGTSKYTGVSWYKNRNKWRSTITINGKKKTLGYFNCELAASDAYQKKLAEIN